MITVNNFKVNPTRLKRKIVAPLFHRRNLLLGAMGCNKINCSILEFNFKKLVVINLIIVNLVVYSLFSASVAVSQSGIENINLLNQSQLDLNLDQFAQASPQTTYQIPQNNVNVKNLCEPKTHLFTCFDFRSIIQNPLMIQDDFKEGLRFIFNLTDKSSIQIHEFDLENKRLSWFNRTLDCPSSELIEQLQPENSVQKKLVLNKTVDCPESEITKMYTTMWDTNLDKPTKVTQLYIRPNMDIGYMRVSLLGTCKERMVSSRKRTLIDNLSVPPTTTEPTIDDNLFPDQPANDFSPGVIDRPPLAGNQQFKVVTNIDSEFNNEISSSGDSDSEIEPTDSIDDSDSSDLSETAQSDGDSEQRFNDNSRSTTSNSILDSLSTTESPQADKPGERSSLNVKSKSRSLSSKDNVRSQITDPPAMIPAILSSTVKSESTPTTEPVMTAAVNKIDETKDEIQSKPAIELKDPVKDKEIKNDDIISGAKDKRTLIDSPITTATIITTTTADPTTSLPLSTVMDMATITTTTTSTTTKTTPTAEDGEITTPAGTTTTDSTITSSSNDWDISSRRFDFLDDFPSSTEKTTTTESSIAVPTTVIQETPAITNVPESSTETIESESDVRRPTTTTTSTIIVEVDNDTDTNDNATGENQSKSKTESSSRTTMIALGCVLGAAIVFSSILLLRFISHKRHGAYKLAKGHKIKV